MAELSAQLPAVIAEAAKSPLGIFALMIISLAILGFFFFKEASEKTRIAIFVMLFVGVAVFGLSIVRTTAGTGLPSEAEANGAPPASAASVDDSAESILGTWTADVTYFPPRSFPETFEFEMFAGELMITATFLSSERGVLNTKVENGIVRFDIPWQETDGDLIRDVRNSYTGHIRDDRIDFVMRSDNGDPPVMFQATRKAK